MISRQHNLTYFLCLVLSVVCISCAAIKKDQPDSAPDAIYEREDEAVPSGYYIHTVTLAGESLSIIAKWFTGDLKNWETLAKYNPAINPNRIFFGDKIKIPHHLMTRHDPITLKFIEKSQPKSRQRVAPTAPPKKIEEEPQQEEPEEEPFLFGPKGYPRK